MSVDNDIINTNKKDTNTKDKDINIMDMVIVIDKEKLPEDIRKILEDHLSKDLSHLKQNNVDNKLFAIQTGEVVGNIYTDKEKKSK